ncbi:unnamed protein product [Oppiella nova]|uniref:Uncharacterized protein n=1 Tax=Oppiella nova TaxID=334625 RepID=A0A7R9QDJ3_9ACAR|nr:unnamed protein product [Oppiella nova]CAG2163699.1 unnamed protein product [Oppiella nova]
MNWESHKRLEVDISVDMFPIHDSFLTVMDVIYSEMDTQMAIMGGIYATTKSNSLYLSRMDYSILIAVLLFFKNPFSVIDSVEELAAKPELIPMLFSAEADIESLKNIPEVSNAVNKANENYLGYDFEKFVSASREMGFLNKWLEAGLQQAFEAFVNKSFVFEDQEPNPYTMNLDEFKIALGPYLLGILGALVRLFWENLSPYDEEVQQMHKNEFNNEKRRKKEYLVALDLSQTTPPFYSANFECVFDLLDDKKIIPQKFGYDFDLRGNFTFTWPLAMDDLEMKVLCASHLFLIKELVRRTQYGAIPVLINHSRFLTLDDENFDPTLAYIKSNEVDISADSFPLNHMFLSFLNIFYSQMDSTLAIMGGIYPSTKSNPFFGIMNIFHKENPYSVIDSVEELDAKPELIPMLFASEADIEDIQNDRQLSSAVNKTLVNNRERYLGHDFQQLFDGINDLITNISVFKTHVLLASKGAIEHIINLSREKYEKITHLSKHIYQNRVHGYVINANVNKHIAQHFKQIRESGLHMKWIECGIKQAYDTFVDKSFVFELKEKTIAMILDEMRIVLGPYFVGILIAFCVFVLENTDFSNSNLEERAKLEANYEMNEKRRKPFSKISYELINA